MSDPTVRLIVVLETARKYVERHAFNAAEAVVSAVWADTEGTVHERLRAWHGAAVACRTNPGDEGAWNLEARTWRALADQAAQLAEAVNAGVSADLVDALADMAAAGDGGITIETRFADLPGRVTPPDVSVSFSGEDVPALRRLSADLKS